MMLFILTGGATFAFPQSPNDNIGKSGKSLSGTKQPDRFAASPESGAVGTGVCNRNGNGRMHRFSRSKNQVNDNFSNTAETLSTKEIHALNVMREEELLAHDVYTLFHGLYQMPVFKNISEAETRHAEAVKQLMLKYNLDDPAANHVAGKFTNPDMQALYNSLALKGKSSLVEALVAGATVEDMDLNDLHNHIANDVENQDIMLVFGNLEKGSRNHLRAFNKHLAGRGINYAPKYISQEYYNQIIMAPHESGPASFTN